MRTITLNTTQSNALKKIARRSKMDCWFAISSIDGTHRCFEQDINTLFDGVTDFDIETLEKSEVTELFKLLIECKPIKRK